MRASVILPTYNRCDMLARTLPKLLRQNFSPEHYEVIVIDDGSTDGTRELLETFQESSLRISHQSHSGPAIARNLGLTSASGEFVLMLDDDLECGPDLISSHLEAQQKCDFRHCITVGEIVVEDKRNVIGQRTAEWLSAFFEFLRKGIGDLGQIRFGPNCCARRDFLLEVGGYDPDFRFAHEDAELGWRLLKAGARFSIAPSATVKHLGIKSNKAFIVEGAVSGGAAEVSLCRKHPEYRPYSLLAKLSRPQSLLGWAGAASLRFPISAAPIIACLRRLCALTGNGRLVARLVGYEYSLRLLRSAAKACGGWDNFRNEFWHFLPVLLYHNVAPVKRSRFPELTVSPEQFAAQMSWLHENEYNPIMPNQWHQWLATGEGLPPRPILITFDDAYQNLVDFAFPVLESLGFPATVFIPTAYLDGRNEWDTPMGAETLQVMSAKQVREWAKRGINFGGHSRSHVNLAKQSNEIAASEVSGCASDLAILLQCEPVSFAYPWGVFNEEVVSLVSSSFKLAFTTTESLNGLATSPFELHRTMVMPSETLPAFALRVRFGFNPVMASRNWARNLLFS